MQEATPLSQCDWNDSSLERMIEYIVATHHAFCRQQVTSIALLLREALGQHKKEHPELAQIQTLFLKMSRDLAMHLVKEEETLFPYIEQVEHAVAQGAAVSWPPFGSVENPVRMMVMEHDQTGDELREIRKLSKDFIPPPDASVSLTELYKALEAFERDMDLHIDIENRGLFPRAVAMEEQACARKGKQ